MTKFLYKRKQRSCVHVLRTFDAPAVRFDAAVLRSMSFGRSMQRSCGSILFHTDITNRTEFALNKWFQILRNLNPAWLIMVVNMMVSSTGLHICSPLCLLSLVLQLLAFYDSSHIFWKILPLHNPLQFPPEYI